LKNFYGKYSAFLCLLNAGGRRSENRRRERTAICGAAETAAGIFNIFLDEREPILRRIAIFAMEKRAALCYNSMKSD